MPRTLLVGFEPSHLTRIVRRWRSEAGPAREITVLALDAELESLLEQERIPYLSGSDLREPGPASHLIDSEAWVSGLLSSGFGRQFEYRDIPLLRIYAYSLQFYLAQVLYYVPLLGSALVRAPSIVRIEVCGPARRFSGDLMRTRDPAGAVLRAARFVASSRGIGVFVLPDQPAVSLGKRFARIRSLSARAAFGLLITGWNALVSFVPERSVRILASENWHNIRLAMERLPEAEIVLLDRAEIRNIGLSTALRHRMRFLHLKDQASAVQQRRASHAANALRLALDAAAEDVPDLVQEGISLKSVVTEAVRSIFVHGLPRLLADIEGAEALLDRSAPHVVLLRTSVSAQTHFPMLGLVARARGIPSLELQHGLEYLGPGSLSREHTAEYIAAYGPLVQREIMSLGYAEKNVPIIGSPRFDTYQVLGSSERSSPSAEFAILAMAPDMVPAIFDSYEAVRYYEGVASAARGIAGASITFKLRPGPGREGFHRRIIDAACAGIPYRIVQHGSVGELLDRSDLLITCYSTVVLEAFASGTAACVYAANPAEQLMARLHFTQYEDAGALKIAYDASSLGDTLSRLAADPQARTLQVGRARDFLASGYSFDGHASERMRDLILNLAGRAA